MRSNTNRADVVLITGGSAGIGWAAAQRFLRLGYRVAICGRDAAALERCRQAVDAGLVPAFGGGQPTAQRMAGGSTSERLLTCVCDMGQAEAIERMVERIRSQWGSVSVLVNNAASAPLVPCDQTTEADLAAVWAVNVAGPWRLTQAIWPDMVARGGGVVVNISSLAAVDPFVGFSLYGASKAWVETWTRALANEGQAAGIRVVGVRPGAVETGLLRQLFPDFPADQCVAADEVAAAIESLVTSADHPTGTIVTVAKPTC